MQREHTLTGDNIFVLKQGVELLRQISDQVYTNDGLLACTAGMGGHFRHCFDFYNCFLNGIEQGQIDYNLRERSELFATSRQFAASKYEEVIARLEQLPVTDGQAPLLVREDTTLWSQSSLLRELQFLLSHTIHHYALIATLLRMQGVEPGHEFGVAPSTLAYWKAAAVER